eukprot:GEMP01090589.1.p1 GENE.GEMP01090589.1~~GEMP01090589.1.p1  ORF type:complete len:256 (+),score=27.73 GEMP01090589.1:36-803(+)
MTQVFDMRLKAHESRRPAFKTGHDLMLRLSRSSVVINAGAEPLDDQVDKPGRTERNTLCAHYRIGGYDHEYTLGTFWPGEPTHQQMDLVFDPTNVTFVNRGPHEVHISGWFEPGENRYTFIDEDFLGPPKTSPTIRFPSELFGDSSGEDNSIAADSSVADETSSGTSDLNERESTAAVPPEGRVPPKPIQRSPSRQNPQDATPPQRHHQPPTRTSTVVGAHKISRDASLCAPSMKENDDPSFRELHQPLDSTNDF